MLTPSDYLLAGGAINAVGHRWGRRPFDNLATNNQWLAWLVGRRRSAQQPPRRGHFEPASACRRANSIPAWWCIRLMVWLRWATLRQTHAVVPVGAGLDDG